MSIQVIINGVDRTKQVSANTIQIQNILTRKRDTCDFQMVNRESDPFTPVVGMEVIVYLSSTKVFGGVITELEQSADVSIIWKVSCTDYTRLLDRRLVPDTFSNQTVNQIIASLQTNYFPAGFTITNVDCPTVIKYISFNYLPLSKCIEQLAELTDYDYYIDYDKDLHFFKADNNPASTDVMDSNGTYVRDSLIIRKDNSQVRNSIIVRGGEYLGSTFTSVIQCNGVDTIYPLGYKYNNFKATLTGQPLNLGIDYLNPPENYDAMYNFNEKIIRFRDSRKPNDGADLRVSGQPYLPVIVKAKSPIDISTMSAQEGGDGIYEFLIVDKSIDSKEGARQRAYAEMKTYATTLTEGEFETLTTGLRAGQKILVNSTSRGINDYYIINKVTLAQFDYQSFSYKISLITTKSFDLVDFLSRLLQGENKKIEINVDEVIDLVENVNEAITMTETFTAQSLNYEVEFVAGPQLPTGTKRVFCVNGSRLG